MEQKVLRSRRGGNTGHVEVSDGMIYTSLTLPIIIYHCGSSSDLNNNQNVQSWPFVELQSIQNGFVELQEHDRSL